MPTVTIDTQVLLDHLHHDIEIATYRGADGTPANVSLECLDCHAVLADADLPTNQEN